MKNLTGEDIYQWKETYYLRLLYARTYYQHAYPSDKLTEEAIKEIQSDIARYLAASKVLSTFPLENGDAPATWFRAAPLADS